MADDPNTMSLSRRTFAKGAALVSVLASSVPAAAALPSAAEDQGLLDLFRTWEVVHARYEVVADEAGSLRDDDQPPALKAEHDLLLKQVLALEDRASGIPARTVHGLAAKVRIISAYERGGILEIEALTQSLFEDIFALEEADNGRPRKNALAGGGND